MAWRRLLIILTIGAILLLLADVYGPGGRQRRGMAAARTHMEQVSAAVAADPRFASVKLAVATHPSLHIRGDVADQDALDDLRRIIGEPLRPGYQVRWSVTVAEVPDTRPGR